MYIEEIDTNRNLISKFTNPSKPQLLLFIPSAKFGNKFIPPKKIVNV